MRASEREALWARLGAASFLTDDEKRAAVGYAPKDGGQTQKFNPNHDAAGRFTFADGGGDGASGGLDAAAASKLGAVMELLKQLAKPLMKVKPGLQKLPKFLEKGPGAGKIIGRLEELTPAERCSWRAGSIGNRCR